MSISPNMSLPIPEVGVTSGPDWATLLDSCLNIIDGHDHTSGNGVKITPNALNINSALTFNGMDAINLRTTTFNPQLSTLSLSDKWCLYSSGVDLYFNDGNGSSIRITQSGNLVGSPGTITGLFAPATAAYSSPSSTFVFQSAGSTPANLDVGNVIVRKLTLNSKGITIAPNSSISADYNLTLPASPPVQTSFLTMDFSGNISTISTVGGISGSNIGSATITGGNIAATTITGSNLVNSTVTGSKIALNTITVSNMAPNSVSNLQIVPLTINNACLGLGCVTGDKIYAGTMLDTNFSLGTIDANKLAPGSIGNFQLGSAIIAPNNMQAVSWSRSSSCGTFSATSSGSAIDITNLSFTFNPSGFRPIVITCIGDTSVVTGSYFGSTSFGTIDLFINKNGSTLNRIALKSTGSSIQIAPSSIFYVDTTTVGDPTPVTVKIQILAQSGENVTARNIKLFVYEL